MGKIFQAKKISTMDQEKPFVTHVAVDGNKIVGVGGVEIVDSFPGFVLDSRFANYTILPGFVEGHAHLVAGQDGLAPYVGYFDRPSPEGELKGLKSMEEIISYLQECAIKLGPNEPLIATGFDPIYFSGKIGREDLDKVSADRVVLLMHASGHLITANTKALGLIPQEKLDSTSGVAKDQDGKPTGELQEIKAMTLAFTLLGESFLKFSDPTILFPRFVKLAQMAGVTTITDMGVDLSLDDPKQIDLLLKITNDVPLRLVPMYFVPMTTKKPEDIPDYVKSLQEKNTEKLRFGHVKFMSDGSIQGYTARLTQPYINGVQNGIWNQDPDQLKMYAKLFNSADMQVNCHCNGDEASGAFIEAIKEALSEHPFPDNRHTVQHAQMLSDEQFNEVKNLGMGLNIFTNHIYYWGDQHSEKTIGPERANNLDRAGTAKKLGIPFSMHCDASVTPIAPLFNAWTAVNRTTATDKVLGPGEKITVADALYAMTMGSAYLLKLENEIGSISVGKKADFVVLGQDPYEVDQKALKDVPVITTVFGGEVTSI